MIDESGLAGARRGHLVALLRGGGAARGGEAPLAVSRDFLGLDDWWEPFTHGVGPAGAYVAGLEQARRVELREACRSMLPGGSFTLTAVAWAARGVVGAAASPAP